MPAHECEFGSLGLTLVVGRAPEPLHGARGRSGVPLAFWRPSRILFVQKEGLFAEPLSASLGHWVSARFAGRAPEPPHGARGRSGVPLAFYATLAHPFCSEGGVEYARLPSVGASGDTSGELLSGKSEWRSVPHSIGSASGPETHSKGTIGLLYWVPGPFDWP